MLLYQTFIPWVRPDTLTKSEKLFGLIVFKTLFENGVQNSEIPLVSLFWNNFKTF